MKHVLIAAAALLLSAQAALADGNTENGEKLFNSKCKICHAAGEGAINKTGPILNGVVGRPLASLATYKSYGEGLKAKAATVPVWTEAALTEYIHSPKKFNETTKMLFAGLASDTDVADVIAYLKQFDADGKKK